MFLEYSALSSIGQETWLVWDSLDNFLQSKSRQKIRCKNTMDFRHVGLPQKD
jgi:hypothetical protein